MKVIAIMMARKANTHNAVSVVPYTQSAAAALSAVRSSTRGYRNGIFQWHERHLPPKTIHEKSGMLSYHAIVFLQFGHMERPRATDWLRGMRWMTTFRKLPNNSPNTPDAIVKMSLGVM